MLAIGTEQQYATTYSSSVPSAKGLGRAMVTVLQGLLREIYDLSAGCSLLISPGRCLGLEPKWHCHFGIPRQRTHLYYVSILMMGCLWGFAGVDILRTSTKTRFVFLYFGKNTTFLVVSAVTFFGDFLGHRVDP